MAADEAPDTGGPEAPGKSDTGGPDASGEPGSEAPGKSGSEAPGNGGSPGLPAEPPADPAAMGSLPPPTLEAVRSWEGCSVEDIDGAGVAKVSGCFVDAEGGEPSWLLAKLGRFGDEIAIPLHDCAPVAGKVWVPYHRDALREAPVVDPSRPLNREQELAICEHFGVVTTHGRAAAVSPRPAGATTSHPPSS